MPTPALITFHKIDQEKHMLSGDPNKSEMVSRVYFTLEIDGKKHNLSAILRQPPGTKYGEGFEAEPPDGYKGNWNLNAFREAAEDYYRSITVGSQGVIRTSGGVNLQMSSNTFQMTKQYTISIPD